MRLKSSNELNSLSEVSFEEDFSEELQLFGVGKEMDLKLERKYLWLLFEWKPAFFELIVFKILLKNRSKGYHDGEQSDVCHSAKSKLYNFKFLISFGKFTMIKSAFHNNDRISFLCYLDAILIYWLAQFKR